MTNYYEDCGHGRHVGAYCETCEEAKLGEVHAERQATGLDAPYYDLPKNIRSAQDLIEYLDLNFANGNILKSLVRQYGSTTKNTEDIYEAEKRFFFAERELERVRRNNEMERQGKRLRQQREAERQEDRLRESLPDASVGADVPQESGGQT